MNMAGSNKALGHFGEVALLLVSVLISYSIAEAAYRAVQYVTLPGRIAALGQATIASAGGEYAFDADVGYRYGPNQDVTFAAPWNRDGRTNRARACCERRLPDGEAKGRIPHRRHRRLLHRKHRQQCALDRDA